MHSLIRRLILAAALMAGLVPVMAQVPPPVPGLPDTERRTSYSISGTTCACSVGFALYGDSTDYQDWLEVFINGTQVTYNDPMFGWTITSATGPLATIPRPITDAVLTFNSVQTGAIQIVGARRPRRVSQFSENAGVSARNLNQAITDLVAMLREDWDKINDVTGRGVFAPPGETMSTLPPAANRANHLACWDSNGRMTVCASAGSTTLIQGANILLSGTNPTTISAVIPAPGASTLGGVNSKDCSTGNQNVQKINTDGSIGCSTNTATVSEQKNTASGGLATSGNCDNTTTNAGSPCNYAMALNSAVVEVNSGLVTSVPGTTATMMGWGGSCHITPIYSTRIEIEMTGTMSETSGGGLTLTARWGTGTAPANSGAAAGTVVGSGVSVNGSGTTGVTAPFKIGGIVTGLTVGTAVWFDAIVGLSGSTSLANPSCRAHEVL